MARRLSMCINIAGLLSRCKTTRQTEKELKWLLKDQNGTSLPPAYAKKFLQNELKAGRKLMPCNSECGNPCGNADKGCTGFDYQESGCPGYEISEGE